MEKHLLTENSTHIQLNDSNGLIIQNQSIHPIKWNVADGSTEWFTLAENETIIVDFDIWAKSNSYYPKIMVGRI